MASMIKKGGPSLPPYLHIPTTQNHAVLAVSFTSGILKVAPLQRFYVPRCKVKFRIIVENPKP